MHIVRAAFLLRCDPSSVCLWCGVSIFVVEKQSTLGALSWRSREARPGAERTSGSGGGYPLTDKPSISGRAPPSRHSHAARRRRPRYDARRVSAAGGPWSSRALGVQGPAAPVHGDRHGVLRDHRRSIITKTVCVTVRDHTRPPGTTRDHTGPHGTARDRTGPPGPPGPHGTTGTTRDHTGPRDVCD